MIIITLMTVLAELDSTAVPYANPKCNAANCVEDLSRTHPDDMFDTSENVIKTPPIKKVKKVKDPKL